MKVLVGCEESQEVTKAFRALGHEAYSCDIQPCSGGHPEWHYQGDVFDIINDGWDLMIAHPPCTYFSKAGMHYLKTKPERKKKLMQSFDFVRELWNAPIDRICIENPVGWLNSNWMKPAQIIHPYYFGDPEFKETCLWLKGLHPLWYWTTDDLFGKKTAVKPKTYGFIIRKSGNKKGEKYIYHWRDGKSGRDRSVTFPGIARAMAEQWGGLVSPAAVKKG